MENNDVRIENGPLANKFDYFSLEEYVDNIDLNDNVLMQAEDLGKDFNEYLKMFKDYGDTTLLLFLIDSFRKELVASNAIENEHVKAPCLDDKNIFFDNFSMNHSRVKKLHQYALNLKEPEEYRVTDACVAACYPQEKLKYVYWYGAKSEDIKKFMDDFINIYRKTSLSSIDNNPFLKSSLIHYLFLRIHPFSDGNGRTSRLLYNIKFTDMINNIYDSKLKISPLHISNSINAYKPSYVEKIDNSIFAPIDSKNRDEFNEKMNRYLSFMLNMSEDQIRFLTNYINSNRKSLDNCERMSSTGNNHFDEVAGKQGVKNLRK